MSWPGGAPRIFVSAGEPSGDLHGAAVVAALRERWPEALIEGFGGAQMAAAGARIRFPMEQMSGIGFGRVLGSIPRHLRLLRMLAREFRGGHYDLVIPIDYPGFHLRVAAEARKAGIKVLYYIAPQLWAWRPERARRLAGAVDRMAVILPFEEPFFRAQGLPAEFVGHPLLDRVRGLSRAPARAELGMEPNARVLGLFPGSRKQEISRHWPLFREVAFRALHAGHCGEAIVAGTALGDYPEAGPIRIWRGAPEAVFAAADAALAKSGTTTLEAALADTPMVVVYAAGWWTYRLARRLMTVSSISLVNLVAGADVVPEFWRRPLSVGAIESALTPLLDPAGPAARAQRQALAEVRARLGRPGAARRVSVMAAELLGA